MLDTKSDQTANVRLEAGREVFLLWVWFDAELSGG